MFLTRQKQERWASTHNQPSRGFGYASVLYWASYTYMDWHFGVCIESMGFCFCNQNTCVTSFFSSVWCHRSLPRQTGSSVNCEDNAKCKVMFHGDGLISPRHETRDVMFLQQLYVIIEMLVSILPSLRIDINLPQGVIVFKIGLSWTQKSNN